jgi:hypothetical protein
MLLWHAASGFMYTGPDTQLTFTAGQLVYTTKVLDLLVACTGAVSSSEGGAADKLAAGTGRAGGLALSLRERIMQLEIRNRCGCSCCLWCTPAAAQELLETARQLETARLQSCLMDVMYAVPCCCSWQAQSPLLLVCTILPWKRLRQQTR